MTTVDSVGRILSNYQAALHLLEDANRRDDLREVLRRTAAEVFTPVRDACAPALAKLVSEVIDGEPADSVGAERQRIAATHSRLIRRRPELVKATDDRAAARLDELEQGSHSAGALFQLLFKSL